MNLMFPGIIESTFLSEVVVVNCIFENNEYGQTNNPTVSKIVGVFCLETDLANIANPVVVFRF
jgi:hypothetical protein